jgi:hypothetical protein
MKSRVAVFAIAMTLFAAGCSRTKSVGYRDTVQLALEQADLQGVTVLEDRRQNTIILGGTLRSNQAKDEAVQVAKSVAANRVIVNQISVEPPRPKP